MGISIEIWRARIGSYSHPTKTSFSAVQHSVTIKYTSLAIRICLFLLLVAQCVERNPGPGNRPESSRGRGNCRGTQGGVTHNSTVSRSTRSSQARYSPNLDRRDSVQRGQTIEVEQRSIDDWIQNESVKEIESFREHSSNTVNTEPDAELEELDKRTFYKRVFGGILAFCILIYLRTYTLKLENNTSYPIILSLTRDKVVGTTPENVDFTGHVQSDALRNKESTGDTEAMNPLSGSHGEDFVALRKPVVPTLDKRGSPKNTEWSPHMDMLSVKEAYQYPMKFAQLLSEASTVKVITPKKFYRVDEDIRVTINIVFKPSNGYNHGGDNIRIHMVELIKGASVSGYVIDHHNGSYTGVLKALWKGECTIIATLKYTRYEIAYLYYARQKLSTVRSLSGKFVKGRSVTTSPCRPQSTALDGSRGLCNLTKLNGGMPWFCQPPKPVSLTCKDLKFITRDDYNENNVLARTKPNSAIWNTKSSMLGKKITITVKDSIDQKTKVEKPMCNRYNLSALWEQPSPTGHFYERRWYPYHCETHAVSYTYCMKNKYFIFYGDSTSRQWAEHLRTRFGCTGMIYNSETHQTIYKNNNMKLTVHVSKHNFPGNCMDFHSTEDYHFPNLVSVKLEDLVRMVDKDVVPVIIVHIYFHYTYYQDIVYRHRVRMLRKSIEFILRNRPDAKILIKGPHLVLKKTLGTCDYFAYVYRSILVEELFPLRDKVIYLDQMDISNAGRVKDIHPNYNIVREMVNQVLAHVCE